MSHSHPLAMVMMSRDHHSHSDPKPPPGMEPVKSSGFSFSNDLMKIRDCNTNKPLKVKRRKTKKELNNAKFKSHTEIFQKKTFPRGVLQRNNMVGKMVAQSGMKGANNSRQVFITENRLTHHQGIFNHEIKSIDIGRLVNQTTKVDLSKTGTAHPRGLTPQSQRQLSLGLIPTPELKKQDVYSSQKDHSPEISDHISDGPWCNQKDDDLALCSQQVHKRASCNQQDHKRASCNQQVHKRASCNQQDHKRASCNQQQHKRALCSQQQHKCASCNQQEHECASCNQQEHECASCNQQDNERASFNEQEHKYASCNQHHECATGNQLNHECASCNQQDHECASLNQKDLDCASCNQQDHKHGSCNQQDHECALRKQQDHEGASSNQQDHERALCNQQERIRASCNQQDHECALGDQQDHTCALGNQKNHEHASYNQQDQKHASYNQQDRKHASRNQKDQEQSSSNQQDHKHTLGIQQDHKHTLGNQQDHKCVSGKQQDHKHASGNQQDPERALCNQPHKSASYNQQDRKHASGNQKDHEQSSSNQQDHKHTLGNQQDHKCASGKQQDNKCASGNQQDHKHASGNQQDHERALCNQPHKSASCNQQDVESTCYNQQDQDPTFCSQLEKEIGKCRSYPQDEDQANLGSETAMSPFRNEPTPILETAEAIVNMLNTHSLFPGHNLINETRQAILMKVRRLRDTKPPPPPESVERNPGHNQPGNAHMYKDLGCSDKMGPDIRKLVQTTHRGRPPFQTTPIWFLPMPSDSPAHTLIKMVSPEDHQNLKDVLNQPIHYGSDCTLSRQYRQIPSQSLPNILHSSSRLPKPRREERKSTSTCRVRKAWKMTSSPLNACSPQVRWRLANDLPTDSTFTHNVPSSDIRHIGTTRATNQECVSRAYLEDISEVQDTSRVKIKEKTSEVFWGGRDPRSSETISPAAIRLLASEQSTHNAYAASNFGSHNGAFFQMSVTNPDGSLCIFPLDSFEGLARRPMSSWQEGGAGPHCVTHAGPNLRRLPATKCPKTWKPSSHLQEEPKQRDLRNDGGRKRMHSKYWRHGSLQEELYSQPRNMSAALSPQSGQRSSPVQRKKSSRKSLLCRPSPDTWVYPRMKLY